MNNPSDFENLAAIVARVMAAEETTLGGPKQPFVLRARGRLLVESESAFAELSSAVKPLGLMPVLREENGRHDRDVEPRNRHDVGGSGLRKCQLQILRDGTVVSQQDARQ